MCAELRHCQRWVTNRERQRVPQWRSRDGKTSLSVGRRIHGSWLHSAYVHGLIRPRSRCMICTTEDCESPTGLSQWIVCVCVCVWSAFLAECQPHFHQCVRTLACHCRAFGLCCMFFFAAAYSVMYRVLPLSNPVFTLYLHESYAIKIFNIKLLQKDKFLITVITN